MLPNAPHMSDSRNGSHRTSGEQSDPLTMSTILVTPTILSLPCLDSPLFQFPTNSPHHPLILQGDPDGIMTISYSSQTLTPASLCLIQRTTVMFKSFSNTIVVFESLALLDPWHWMKCTLCSAELWDCLTAAILHSKKTCAVHDVAH